MGAASVANCAHAGSCLALEAEYGESAEDQSAGHGTSGLDRRRWGASSSHSLERVSSLSASTGAIAEHGQGVRASSTSLLGVLG
jgi:hypothetical protein